MKEPKFINNNLLTSMGELPPQLQQEVVDFVDFLLKKYNSLLHSRLGKNEKDVGSLYQLRRAWHDDDDDLIA